jgi:hypothetical protein
MSPTRHSCTACVELQRAAIRLRDPVLVEAAIKLRVEHELNDAARAAFCARDERRSEASRVTLLRLRRPDPTIR